MLLQSVETLTYPAKALKSPDSFFSGSEIGQTFVQDFRAAAAEIYEISEV